MNSVRSLPLMAAIVAVLSVIMLFRSDVTFSARLDTPLPEHGFLNDSQVSPQP